MIIFFFYFGNVYPKGIVRQQRENLSRVWVVYLMDCSLRLRHLAVQFVDSMLHNLWINFPKPRKKIKMGKEKRKYLIKVSTWVDIFFFFLFFEWKDERRWDRIMYQVLCVVANMATKSYKLISYVKMRHKRLAERRKKKLNCHRFALTYLWW